ncbi:MAG: efflux RND transporter permease subunit [Deltaproteobacteria bacterium]|nr:efflux RND transporter permease subunit [Deltaproteobacteria bacterium]
MSNLVKFFINRPMLINIIVLAVIGLGIKSVIEVRKEGFPEISMNKVIIQTIYPGSSAGDVELNVTVPIEDELEEVEGIKEVLSFSEEGVSRIEVQADDNASPEEFRKLYNDIESALASLSDLPEDIEGKPSISEFTSSDIPVMEVSFTGQYEILKSYIDRLEPKIKKLSGVANVTVIGLPDEEVQILVDPIRAREYKIDLKMIFHAIQKRNLEGSGGTLESIIGEKKVVFLSKFVHYKDVLETNIIMNDADFGVKLKQIASLKVIPKEMNLIVRNNGDRGATLSIKKTGSSDLIRTVDGINSLLKKETFPEGVSMKVLFDQSRLTRDRISLLAGNAVIGFILVVAVLFMIFDAKTAVWTAFGIPFTLFGMFIFLYNYGISLNLISLGGFIIIIGMLVDDAIVIAEETNSNKELGMEPKEAAVEAVKKMWIPVAASCLTTMVAFSPLFSLGGFPGKFIWAIPLMVIVGLTISLFESYFVLPAHLSHGKVKKYVKKSFVAKIEHLYKKAISRAVKFRYPFLSFMIILLLLSAVLFSKFVSKDPFPQDAAEGFSIAATLPKGSHAEETEKTVFEMEKLLLKLPENEIIGFSTRIGTQSLLSETTRGTRNNIAVIFVYLKPFSQRKRTAEQIMDALNKDIKRAVDQSRCLFAMNLSRLGPPMGRPFEIRIISNNNELRDNKEKEIRKYLETLPGVYDIENDDVEGKNELNLKINHDILSRTGLTVEDVLTTLRIAFDGIIVSSLSNVDKTIEFRLRLNSRARADKQFIDSLPIANSNGNIINLSMFTTLVEQPSRAGIHHVNGNRATTLFGNTDLKKISPVEVMNRVSSRFSSDDTVSIEFSGQPVETNLIFSGLGSAALAAFIGIYFLISLILNSFSKPLIIMSSIPFLVIGFAFVLITHGIPASMMGGIAMVGLMGVIVNNSIIMVHTISRLAVNGSITKENIIQGSVSRLRPVFLTTITTVLGVLPTGYGIGGSDPFLAHMSLVLAYGLLFGTIITLFMVPLLFMAGTDISKITGKIFGKSNIN